MSESTAQLKRIFPILLIYMVLGFLPIFLLEEIGTAGIVFVILFELLIFAGMLFAVCYKIKDHKWKYLILGDDFKKQLKEHQDEFFDVEEVHKVQMQVAKDTYRTNGCVSLDVCVKPMILYPMPPEMIAKEDNLEECQAFLNDAVNRFVAVFRHRFVFRNAIKLYFSADGRERYSALFFPEDKKYAMLHEKIMFFSYPDGHEYYRQGYWALAPDNAQLADEPADSLEDLLFQNRFRLLDFEEDTSFVPKSVL